METFETLLYEERDGVAVVTLNRPEVHNAFNLTMQRELKALWRSLRRHDEVRAVILTGAGEKAFCAGMDREESVSAYLNDPSGKHRLEERAGRVGGPFMFNDPGEYINPKQNDLWKPVIAAVNGMACGGALYLLGESDIILAAEHATFFDPHVTYGMVMGFETVHLLQKLPLGETLRVALLRGPRANVGRAEPFRSVWFRRWFRQRNCWSTRGGSPKRWPRLRPWPFREQSGLPGLLTKCLDGRLWSRFHPWSSLARSMKTSRKAKRPSIQSERSREYGDMLVSDSVKGSSVA